MTKHGARGQPSRGRVGEVDDPSPLVSDEKLEAIRRQLDQEFPGGRRRQEPDPETIRRDRDSSDRARVRILVAGLLIACAVGAVAMAMYWKHPGAPGADRPVSQAPPPEETPPPTPTRPPSSSLTPPAAPPAGTTPSPTPAGTPTAKTAPPTVPTAPPAASSAPRSAPSTAPAPRTESAAPPVQSTAAPARGEEAVAKDRSAEPVTLPPRPPRETLLAPPPRLLRNPSAPSTPGQSGGPSSMGPGQPSAQPGTAVSEAVPPGQADLRPGASAPPAPAGESRVASVGPGMTRYSDPLGLFGIEYPAGWRVRSSRAGTTATTFFLDDAEEGIAVIVVPNGTVQGAFQAERLAPILLEQIRRTYPDFTFTAVSTRPLPGVGEQSQFSALWTNRWAQRMRGRGVIVSAPRGSQTVYSYVAGQAQELAFPGVEPIIQRMLDSFQAALRG